MTNFSILTPGSQKGLLYKDVTIRTRVDGDVAAATVHRERGVLNPLGFVLPELFSAPLVNRGRTSDIAATGPLADALRGLHELGSRHKVTGISLGTNTSFPGLVMFEGDIGYEGGTDRYKALGPAAREIDTAARRVVELLPTK